MKIGPIASERHLERSHGMTDSGVLLKSSPTGKPRSPYQLRAVPYVWPLGWLRYTFLFSSATPWKTLKDIAPQQGFFSSPSHLPSDTDIQPVRWKGEFCLNGSLKQRQAKGFFMFGKKITFMSLIQAKNYREEKMPWAICLLKILVLKFKGLKVQMKRILMMISPLIQKDP